MSDDVERESTPESDQPRKAPQSWPATTASRSPSDLITAAISPLRVNGS